MLRSVACAGARSGGAQGLRGGAVEDERDKTRHKTRQSLLKTTIEKVQKPHTGELGGPKGKKHHF